MFKIYKERDKVAIALFIFLAVLTTVLLSFALYFNQSVKIYEQEIELKEEKRVHQILEGKLVDINNNKYTYNELIFDIVQGNSYILEDKRGRFIDLDKYREGSSLYLYFIKSYVRENADRDSILYREVFEINDEDDLSDI